MAGKVSKPGEKPGKGQWDSYREMKDVIYKQLGLDNIVSLRQVLGI
jgi:hypothetical protein